jgi:RNA polymerase sigma factor (sigma-70 family)
MIQRGENPEPFSLETAFELYQQNLLNTTVRLLKNRGVENSETIAPDIVQNVFLKLTNRMSILPSNKIELIRFLQRIAQSEVESYLEYHFNTITPSHRKIRESDLEPQEKARGLTVPPNQEITMASETDFESLINSVRNLTEDQKKVLILHYVEGKNFREIARELNMHHSRVGQLEHQALSKLERNPKFKNLLKQ